MNAWFAMLCHECYAVNAMLWMLWMLCYYLLKECISSDLKS